MTDALHTEAKRRFLLAHPTTAPEAFDAWLGFALQRGATIVLQLDGCRAEYPRTDTPAVNVAPAIEVPPITQQASTPSSVKPARAKSPRRLESRLPSRVDLGPVPGIESAPAGRLGGVR